jgi:hypothetical protein
MQEPTSSTHYNKLLGTNECDSTNMKNATACPFFGGGTPGLLSIEGKSSNEHLLGMRI